MIKTGLSAAILALGLGAGCGAAHTAVEPLGHDEFYGRLRERMTLDELRGISRGIPYRRYWRMTACLVPRWAEFAYRFPGDTTVSVAVGVSLYGPAMPEEFHERVLCFTSTAPGRQRPYPPDSVHFETEERVGGNEQLFDKQTSARYHTGQSGAAAEGEGKVEATE
ncbi:MAG: hypothetical protein ACYS9X_24975 [Planctomycetota bacterium]|jgi:hypothetical protein